MEQTQTPPATDEGTRTDAPQGVDRRHLRSYEELRRSTTDRKIAGVAGGLARHLDVDPTVVRVLLVVSCFFGGAGLLLYGVAWLVVPEDGRDEGRIGTSPSTRNGLLIATGIIAAVLVLANSRDGLGFPWPLFVVGVLVVVWLSFRDRRRERRDALAGTAGGTVTGADLRRARRERGPLLFGPTMALVAVGLGVLGVVDLAGGSVAAAAYPALALALVGLALVVGAFVGRPGGLVLAGLVAAAALGLTSLLAGASHDDQRIDVAPATAAGVRPSYDITSGRIRLDLSQVTDPAALDGRTLDVDARAGELVVLLPRGVVSEVTARIDGPGQVDLPDRQQGGIGTELAGVYGDGPATVTIRTHLSVGHIDVRNP